MRRWTLLVTGFLACSTPNPRSCIDGLCNDPRFPFCDVNGTLGGVELECVSVACEPETHAECRGRSAVTCNADGTDYVVEECERACTPMGCQRCDPTSVTCVGETLTRCNQEGFVEEDMQCPFGCAEGEARCRELVPSNSLADHVVPGAFEQDLVFSGGATIRTDDGLITGGPPAASVLIPSPSAGRAIRLFFGGRIVLGDVTIVGASSESPAVAFYAGSELIVEGVVRLSTANGFAAGAFASATCTGTGAGYLGQSPFTTAGGGGGGHATAGGSGGEIPGVDPSTWRPGEMNGSLALIPLRGGCGSGTRSSGGGAIQLASGGGIRIHGTLDVRGAAGVLVPGDPIAAYGGGAGGGVLLEGATIELTANAKILATGGSGASRQASGMQSDDATPAIGAPCSLPNCGRGGNGGAPGVPPQDGGMAMFAAGGSGAGGGGLGFLRINTRDSTYVSANAAIEAASTSRGLAAVR